MNFFWERSRIFSAFSEERGIIFLLFFVLDGGLASLADVRKENESRGLFSFAKKKLQKGREVPGGVTERTWKTCWAGVAGEGSHDWPGDTYYLSAFSANCSL